MRNQGIGSWTARRARKTPNAVAVLHGDVRSTYARLHERSTRLAHGLRDLGVRRGDRVAFLGPNHPAFLETLFAAGTIGAVFVPLNTRLAATELGHCLTDSGSQVLVHEPGREALVDAATAGSSVRHRLVITGNDGESGASYEVLLRDRSAEPLDEPVTLDDPCVIMYTSGTTGRAKGAVLTHGNLTWNSVNVLVDIDLAADEVTLVVAPLFHTAGLNMTCLPTLLKGGTVVLAPAFDPDGVLETIERHGVTYMFGVPAMYDAIAASPKWAQTDLSSLRQVNCGGAPVPPHTIRTYQERGLAFSQGYGMTEASPGALYLTRDSSEVKAGTAGVPHFFTDVRIADPAGQEAGVGEKGEILVSGPNVMSGYWGLADATAAAFTGEGWFRSGDVGVLDEDGFVSVVDRIKEVIISGGENIYPAEVEAVLYDHPAVSECAVIGVQDSKWGEVGLAVVAVHDEVRPGELLAFLQERIARYKVPKTVTFVDELPRNATGKILKTRLRAQYGRPDQTGEHG
ncbi:fatty-acyl-CoA synthase [Amycolatopsis marina]|uniref:Fatty-acyl-CoA synthase n=1 Tax=Amycolatopsis marina TaxID=490629 RepID=A0A1I1C5K5_9PSEU|nr:long-chain fatty acid--CoA ligase [Amycolatopsis marina]SFB56188.1 fatty-acyl-CoA synthase [Amycolatopsis marina]